MLIGEYQHIIDAKGRVFIPARLREELGDRVYISKGFADCLNVYSPAQWEILQKKFSGLPLSRAGDIKRYFFSGAGEAETDKMGRVLIPPVLRSFASLTKNVVVLGVDDHAEIWDADRWFKRREEITPDAVLAALEESNM